MTRDTVPDDVVPPLRRLELARDDIAERARVLGELASSYATLEHARTEHQRLRDLLSQQECDVERLEGHSLSRLWSSLRGSRALDLERERAQARAAAGAVEVQAREVERLRESTAALARSAAALEHAEADYESALEGVAGSGGAVDEAQVAAAATELADRRELRDVEQACTAGRSALQGLLAAQQTLRSADSWSTWDTFGGGGVLSSTMKHERLDEARQRLTVAQETLTRFSRELDDLHLPAITLPEFGGLVRGLDIWWDNVGVDLLVRDQIKRTQHGVDTAVVRVEEALTTLEARRAALAR